MIALIGSPSYRGAPGSGRRCTIPMIGLGTPKISRRLSGFWGKTRSDIVCSSALRLQLRVVTVSIPAVQHAGQLDGAPALIITQPLCAQQRRAAADPEQARFGGRCRDGLNRLVRLGEDNTVLLVQDGVEGT